jgi:hypothetical protein
MRRSRSRILVTRVTQQNAGFEITSKSLIRAFEAFMFSHTQNENGTFNTRCLHCFMTIASAVESREELERLEAHHICPEKALADLLARQTSAPSRPHVH